MAQHQATPKVYELFSDFQVTVAFPGQAETDAKIMDIGFRSLCLALKDMDTAHPVRGAVHVMMRSQHVGAPIEAVCRVQSLVSDQDDTLARLEVVDWIGLREQLPEHLRPFLSLREVERMELDESRRIEVTAQINALRGKVEMFDLSVNGLSVLVPAGWCESTEKGDRMQAQFTVDGGEPIQMVGFVRRVTFDGDASQIGMLFDINLTSNFLFKQLQVMRYLDGERTRAL